MCPLRITFPSILCRAVVFAAAGFLGACGPRPIELPSGPSTVLADPGEPFVAATDGCGDLRTLTAEMGLSGRAGGQRVRGTLLAGLARGGRLRLEALAPFGQPVFILVARDDRATLLLTRDERVVSDVGTAAVLDAIAGLRFSGDDLLAIVTACAPVGVAPVSARRFAGGWTAITLEDDTVMYVRDSEAGPVVTAVERAGVTVEYEGRSGRLPGRVRLQTAGAAGQPGAALELSLQQVETNVELGPEVFEVRVPERAVPMTIEELRRTGLLGPGT